MTQSQQLMYKCKDGTRVPLFEADYDLAFRIYRVDRSKAVIADPRECIEAKGMCRLNGVKEAFVSSGKNAYCVYEGTPSRPFPHALHFIVPTGSGKIRDAFDQDKQLKYQTIWMRAPKPSQTRSYQKAKNRERSAAVKAGEVRKKRGKIAVTRVERLGIGHRPKADITRTKRMAITIDDLNV